MSDYGGQHQATRRTARAAAYGTPCVRCGRVMFEGEPIDLDHHDDRDGYRGFAHARCNRSAGGKLGAARRWAGRRKRKGHRRVLTNVVLGLQIAQDRSFTSIAAAQLLEDGVVAGELVEYLPGSSAVEEVLQYQTRTTVIGVVIDGRSPAATLIAPLEKAGVVVTQPTTVDLTVAHGDLLDRLKAGTLRVAGHPALDAAARHGTQRPLSGAQSWERRGAAVDIGPLDALTLAVWGACNIQAQPFFASVRTREEWR